MQISHQYTIRESQILEVFEQRFGRLPTTALVGTIGIALFLFSLRTIFEIGKQGYEQAFPWLSVAVVSLLGQGFLLLVLVWVFNDALYRFYVVPVKKNLDAKAKDIELKFNAKMAEAHARLAETEAMIETRSAELHRRESELDERIAALNVRFDALKKERSTE